MTARRAPRADLETFYKQVLPADVAAARRITAVKPSSWRASTTCGTSAAATNEEEIDESSLVRLTVSDDACPAITTTFAAFIYALETSPDFLVIDNVGIGRRVGTWTRR